MTSLCHGTLASASASASALALQGVALALALTLALESVALLTSLDSSAVASTAPGPLCIYLFVR